jgi:urease beta subunit
MLSARDAIRFDGVHCSIVLERPADRVVLLRISGTDTGELGDAPMQTLDHFLTMHGPIQLFIDARAVRGASIDVSSEWAGWLSARRKNLVSITMLTGSRLIQITAEFVRRFADLNGIMWVCTDPEVFDLALFQALKKVAP